MKKTTITQAEKLRQKLTAELAQVRRKRATLQRAGLVTGTIYEKEGGYLMLNTNEDSRRRRLYLGKPGSKEVKNAEAGIARGHKHHALGVDERNLVAALAVLENGIKDAMHEARSQANGQTSFR
ncbi:MAG: hypothetical protein WD151_15170 [Phycisphaeraceae bacterium]